MLEANNSAQLELAYTPVKELAAKFLRGNPKRHDIGQLWESMERYGFRDPIAYDTSLNDGQGGIVEGNGRLETLLWAFSNGQEPPRGIRLDSNGQWHVPVILGCDARDMAEAVAYSFDHNTMVLSGGEFTALDASRLYDPESYTALLEQLAKDDALPLTVDGDDLALLLEQMGEKSDPKSREPKGINCVCPNCGHEFVKQL